MTKSEKKNLLADIDKDIKNVNKEIDKTAKKVANLYYSLQDALDDLHSNNKAYKKLPAVEENPIYRALLGELEKLYTRRERLWKFKQNILAR